MYLSNQKVSAVYRYFVLVKAEQKASCTLCQKDVKKKDSSTKALWEHLRVHHKAEFKELRPQKIVRKPAGEGTTRKRKRRVVNNDEDGELDEEVYEGEELSLDVLDPGGMKNEAFGAHPSFYGPIGHHQLTNGGTGPNELDQMMWADDDPHQQQQQQQGGTGLADEEHYDVDLRLKLAKIAYLEAQTELAVAQTNESRLRAQLLEGECRSKNCATNNNDKSSSSFADQTYQNEHLQ